MSELDPVIHAAARLRITAALATLHRDESITFPRLQELLEMTAGNLSTHVRKLEEAGYVAVEKTHRVAPRPPTCPSPSRGDVPSRLRRDLRSVLGEQP